MGLRDYFLHGSSNGRFVPVDLQRQAESLKQMCAGNSTGGGNERLQLEFGVSNAMSFFLTSSEMEAVWKTLAAGPCFALASPQEREWFKLFQAVGTRNAGAMLEGAKSLLANGDYLSSDLKRYLLAVGMLGALSQGKREDSSRLWSEYGVRLFDGSNEPTLVFRMLAAESRPPDP